MLWWLAAAALPFLIPWLVLRAPRPTRFAAVEILLRARDNRPLPQRLGRLTGPLLRACMLILVAVALAGPEFRTFPQPAEGGPALGGHVAFLTKGTPHRDGTPPLMAAVMAASPLECRLSGPFTPAGEDPPVSPAVALTGARAIVLCDGVVLDDDDRERVAGFVERGGTAVVLFGPASMAPAARPATAALVSRLGGPRLPDDVGPQVIGPDEPAGASLEVAFGRSPDVGPPVVGFADVFLPLEGPRVRRFVPLDAIGRSGDGQGSGQPVIARLRRPSGGEAVAAVVRRGAGLAAFVGVPLELPGLGDGDWQGADTTAPWDDLASWPGFVDLVRRVFVPILEGFSTESAPASGSVGDPSAGEAATMTGRSRMANSSVRSPAGDGLAGTLLLLALIAASIDPLCGIWAADRRGR